MHSSIKYELTELERLIETGFEALHSEAVSIEFDRIEKALIQEVFSFEDERHLERYIQYHQKAIISMLDSNALNEQGTNPAIINFQNRLENLLSLIERHFAKYFDQDAKAPEGYITKTQKLIRASLNHLLAQFVSRDVNPKLIESLLHALNKITDKSGTTSLTYRKLIYAKDLLKELERVTSDKAADLGSELRQLLYYLNYNATKAVVFHAYFIGTLLKDSKTRNEKIQRLSFLRKEINQAQIRPGVAYNPRAPSLKTQLNNYITEEIDYLEQVQTLNLTSTSVEKSNAFKIRVAASVSQFAYFIKVFVETTIVQNSNLTELLKFSAKAIMTRRSETVSYDSLRAKFYNVESSTKEAVKEILKSMISYIEKDLT